jgi:hypothetical protein
VFSPLCFDSEGRAEPVAVQYNMAEEGGYKRPLSDYNVPVNELLEYVSFLRSLV